MGNHSFVVSQSLIVVNRNSAAKMFDVPSKKLFHSHHAIIKIDFVIHWVRKSYIQFCLFFDISAYCTNAFQWYYVEKICLHRNCPKEQIQRSHQLLREIKKKTVCKRKGKTDFGFTRSTLIHQTNDDSSIGHRIFNHGTISYIFNLSLSCQTDHFLRISVVLSQPVTISLRSSFERKEYKSCANCSRTFILHWMK